MSRIRSWADNAGAFPPEERPKPAERKHAQAIRFQRERGMSEQTLIRIYGTSAVHHALGGET